MATSDLTKAMTSLKKKVKKSYNKIKETEARVGGRTLPGGIKDGVAVIISAAFKPSEKDSNIPNLHIAAVVKEPEEYKDVRASQNFWFGTTEFSNPDSTMEDLVACLKVLELDDMVDEAKDAADLIQKAVEFFNSKEGKLQILYATSNRANKNGEYRVFWQGLAADGPMPERKPRKKSLPFNSGDSVITAGDYFEDGSDYEGTITSVDIDAESCEVEFDDGSGVQSIPFDNLRVTESAAPEEEEEEATEETSNDLPFGVDDLVEVFGVWDEAYTGQVTAVSEETVTIQFEDELAEVPIENVRLNIPD